MATQQPGMLGDLAFIQELSSMGYTPDQMRQMLESRKAERIAATPADQLNRQMVAGGAAQAGRGLAGLFGAQMPEDPMIKQATELRSLQQKYDTTTADGLMEYAQALRQTSPELAMQAAKMAREMKLKESKIQSEDALTKQRLRERQAAGLDEKLFLELAKKATPASVRKAQEAGNDISLLDVPEKDKISTYGQVLIDAGYAKGSAEFRKKMQEFAQAELTGTSKKGQTNITNVIPGIKEVKDVPDFRSKVQSTVKPYTAAIDAADSVISNTDLALKGNFVAFEGATKSLIKALGDGQISAREAIAAGADPSLIGGGVDYVSKLFTGTPSKDTIMKVKQTAEALKRLNEQKRQQELATQRTMASRAGFKDADITDIFAGFGTTPSASKQPKTITLKSGKTVTVED